MYVGVGGRGRVGGEAVLSGHTWFSIFKSAVRFSPPSFSVSALAALAAASLIRPSIEEAFKQIAPACDPFPGCTATTLL